MGPARRRDAPVHASWKTPDSRHRRVRRMSERFGGRSAFRPAHLRASGATRPEPWGEGAA